MSGPAAGPRRVVVTGLGAVTPVGADAPATWAALKGGRSGVGPITIFDASTYPVRIAGLVSDFDPAEHVPRRLLRNLQRAGRFVVAAVAEALADAALSDGVYEPHERGLSLAGSVGRYELQDVSDAFHTRRESDGHVIRRVPPSITMRISQNTAAAMVARLARCSGPLISVSTACAGSAHSIGEAYRRLQDGEARMMIAGGCDALTGWQDVLGFSLLGALTRDYNDDPEHGSRPFERDRTGFVLGEGAVVTVLEELGSARARGARIHGEILGYGSSLNAYRLTDPPPDGGGAVIAMRNALRESGLAQEQVDYVVAHGTGTAGGDLSETIGIKRALGEHAYAIPVSSPKSMTGHTTSAAAALNLIAALGAIRDGVVSPTINYDNPDPECDLDYVPNEARAARVRVALVNAFAFGGTNGALVVGAPDVAEELR
ncbi:MAG: beta-ketoacyl-[acyl-carrier-protein] synthase family protein [Solirubrobacteraceae bacterium]|jgi:3-oxoacyl-[acyl-carrier-protein] synthase II